MISDIGGENNYTLVTILEFHIMHCCNSVVHFNVDKTGADGIGVPIGFSDRRHKMALARKHVIDEQFMFAVRQRRKRKAKKKLNAEKIFIEIKFTKQT